MNLHVLFTEDGTPSWIGKAPREGSEPVEGLSVDSWPPIAAPRAASGGRGQTVP